MMEVECLLSVWLHPATKNHSLVQRESSRSNFLHAPKNAAAHNSPHVLEGKVSSGAAAGPVPPQALAGTRCSALVFASCLWRASRNDVGWCNAVWWSSPPIRSCSAHYLSHFSQCVLRVSNRKLFEQSFCDALEVVPLRPFFFVCLKCQCFKKKNKKNSRTHNEPNPHPLTCIQARIKDGYIFICFHFEFTARLKQYFLVNEWMRSLLCSTNQFSWLCVMCLQTFSCKKH